MGPFLSCDPLGKLFQHNGHPLQFRRFDACLNGRPMFHQPIAVGIGQTVRAQSPSHITAQRFHNIPGYRLDTGAKTPIQPGQCRYARSRYLAEDRQLFNAAVRPFVKRHVPLIQKKRH